MGLFVTPTTLSFQTSVLEEGSSSRAFRVVNRTEETVTIQDLSEVLDEPYGVFEVEGVLWSDLAPGDQLEIPVRFSPLQHQGYSGRIVIPNSWSDDLVVELKGQGDAPFLATGVSAQWEAQAHCDALGWLDVSNIGAERLTLASTGDLDLFELVGTLPEALEPGEATSVPIAFRPETPGSTVEALTLQTNAPGREVWSVPLQGTATEPSWAEEVFHYDAGGGLHLLLLHDDEGPLAENWTSRIDSGLAGFIQDLSARGIHFRIASVSTTSACPGGAMAFGTPEMASAYIAAGLSASLFDPTPGSWADTLLELTAQALTNAEPGSCLEGYLDPAIPMHVVLFTSRDSASDQSWEQGVADIRSRLASALSISVIGSLSCGEALPSYTAAAEETSGIVEDGCATSWDPLWDALADQSAQLETGPRTFPIAGSPILDSLSVTVDGVPTDEWTLLDTDGSLSLLQTPEDGAEIRVRYIDTDACP